MSQEVDSRVVEMRFDNANFEKNTKQTISTIDRLMEKLQFKGAEKGFEKLDAAAENVDFATMQTSLDRLESKFSSLNIVATTALVNITNKFVDAGEKLVKSLSIDQVASGWDKYTEKTSNVQTIMNATGKSIDQVNGYLNKLMWYSDETSYSFSEMTSALSQMTAAGGNIDKMIPMIMGIANATADAGKTGFAFQSTIRNLTQSYSAGHLQLQDWKSLNLMGTATKALKQELIDTAVELGTLKKGEVTIGTFESSLSKKWANTKVMEKTFEKYASMMEAAYEMTQKNKGMTSSEALEKLSGQYGELAERAALAAQQATSFGQAIDSTKDAVSSKWMAVFETFFGNKEEATETWTELSDRLYDIFVPSIDGLNERLKDGLNSGWAQLQGRLGDQADAYSYTLQQVALASGAVTEEQITEAGSFTKALQQNGVSAQLLKASLDEAQTSAEKLLTLSDKEMAAKGYNRETIQRDAEAFAKLNAEIQNGTLDLDEYAQKIGELSGREHLMQSFWNIMDAIGKVVAPVKEAFSEIFPPADGERIYSFAERLDLMTQKLIITDQTAEKIKKTFNGLFTVLKGVTTILSKIGAVAKDAFSLLANAAKPVAQVMLSVGAGLGDFLETIYEVATGSGTLREKLGGIRTALTKLLNPVDALGIMLKNTKIAQYIDTFLEKGEESTGLLGTLYSVGRRAFDGLSAVIQTAASGGIGILGTLGMAISTLLSKLGGLGEKAVQVLGLTKPNLEDFQQNLIDMPKNLSKSMSEFASSFQRSMNKINGSVGDAFAPVKQFFTAVKEGFDAISGTDVYRFMSLIDVGLLAFCIGQMAKATKSLKTMLETPLTGMLNSISGTFKQLTSAIKTWQKNESTKTLTGFQNGAAIAAMAGGIWIAAQAVSSLANIQLVRLDAAMTSIKTLMLLMTTMSAFSSKTKFGSGAAILVMSTSLVVLAGAVGLFAVMGDAAIDGLIKVAAGLTALTIASSMSTGGVSSGAGILLTASALYVLAAAVEKFAALDIGELLRGGISALLGLGSLVGGLVVFTKFGVASALDGLGSAMLKMSAALLILAPAIKLLGDADPETVGQALQVFLDGMLITMLGGALLTAMPQLAVGLELLAKAFWNFAKSLGVIALATAAMGVLSMFAGPICQAIINAAPDIQEALTTVVTMLCEVIKNCAGPIVEAFDALVRAVIPECWQLAKDGLSFLGVPETWGELFSGIGNAMKDAALGIFDWFGEIFEDDRPVGMAVNGIKSLGGKIVEAFKSFFGIASPSKVMAENGEYVMLGVVEGLQNQSVLAQAKAAMHSAAAAIRNVFTTFWGIHSPSDVAASDAENILEGAILGIGDKTKQDELRNSSYNAALAVKDGMTTALDEATIAVQNSMVGLYNAMKMDSLHLGNPIYQNGLKGAQNAAKQAAQDNVPIPSNGGIKKPGNKTPSTVEEIKNAVESTWGKLNPFGALTDYYQNAVDDALDGAGSDTTKSKASKTGKSLADTLASAFSDQLKANKTEMSNATGEYALWEVTGGDTATVEELITKKTESLTREIELQTKRVAIAKEQYDTLLAKVGANNSKTKDAYGTLLSEQKTLAELQRSKQDSILKVIQERYETDAKTAEDEYELWSALYEDSAEVTEKSNKKIDYINRKIRTQAEILLATEKDYIAIKNEFGEASQKTQAAYQQYLEAQTEQQKLINELNQAQLDAYDSKVSYLEKQEKLVTNRQNMLAKLYGDGDLAGREDAYKAAVEQYGADSAQARKAATQGTMTAIIGVGTALDSMSYSLKKVTNKQLKYDEAVKKFGKNSETALDALADLQSEQYNFVGFAENLADAFELDDSGKRMMMQLGYSISKNWRPIQEGFNSVWAQVQKSAPEMASKLSRAFGVATQDGVTEVITDLFGTIAALVSGDWGGAVTGGITTVLDFMGSEFGQTMMNLGKTMLTFNKLAQGGTVKVMGQVVKVTGVTENLGSILGNMSGLLGSATGGTGLLGEALGGLGSIGEMITGSGGLLGGLGELGSTLVSVLGSIGPEGWLIGAAIVGGGLLIANWDQVSEFFSGFFDWLGNAFSNLWDWISNGFKGLVDVGGNLISGLWEGITGAAGAVWNGICDFGSAVVNGFCDFFGIHSPSRVMAGIGEYLSLGLAQGITDETDSVVQGVQDVSDTALSTMMDLAQRVGDIASDDFEYEPSIQPVVDMSDVQNGVDWLNDTLFQNGTVALNAERTAGLAANVVRRAEVTKAQQEEANKVDPKANPNADIVSSVEALGEHIDSIARAVANMKVQMNGRKLVGEIINDVDEGLGKINRRNNR